MENSKENMCVDIGPTGVRPIKQMYRVG